MKRKLKLIAITGLMIGLVGCTGKFTKTVSYTYSVATGDKVKVTLDVSDNYSMTSELPFEISKDGNLVTQGQFITKEDYDVFLATYEESTVFETIGTDKSGITYITWNYEDSEYNYAILINNSNTGVILGNTVSSESAKECFDKLTFTLVE